MTARGGEADVASSSSHFSKSFPRQDTGELKF